MRKLFLLLFILFSGCAYNEYKFGLSVPGTEGGRVDLREAGRLKAVVLEQNSGKKVSSSKIQWRFEGVLAADPGKSGEFHALRPGQGTIKAILPLGDSLKSLETTITVTGAIAKVEPTPKIEDKVEKVAVKVETKATPLPLENDDDEESILKAYSLAESGDYQGALAVLDVVKAPEWLPKVKALRLEWSKTVVDGLIDSAAKSLLDKDLSATLKQLDLLKNLPKNPKQQSQERQIRKRLKELL
ncbi:MAG TPA: hypothetical protein DD435_09955 [Cyanobacteria bacterium UBA8530]|nr:hypothetical protein [Cyanobacteria bacterium UBA8530]